MGQSNRCQKRGHSTIAIALSCLLAISPILDCLVSVPHAFAADTVESAQTAEPEKQAETAPEGSPADEPEAPDQHTEELPLAETAPKPDAPNAPDAEAEAPAKQPNANEQATVPLPSAPEQVVGDVPLSQDDAPALVGAFTVENLLYKVRDDGKTLELAGWQGTAPTGDVIVPSLIKSGDDSYEVTSIRKEAFKGCAELTSLVLPDSLREVGKDAFIGCTKLESLMVGASNERLETHDGMLFAKDAKTLLVCPAGKKGPARIPAATDSLADEAFKGCTQLTAIQVDEGNKTFASVDGALYSADKATLLYYPANVGGAAVVAADATTIAAGAFAEHENLSSIVVNGHVSVIEDGAFPEAALSATVALAAGDDYDARKAVWEKAGFSNFAEPAEPGETVVPDADSDANADADADGQQQEAAGFTYTLLDDYTLSVAWVGEADPDANLKIPATATVDGVSYRVSAIAPGAFEGRTGIESVDVPSSVVAVGDAAFSGCTSLKSANLVDGLATIGASVFRGTALESVVLPATVSAVGDEAFAECGSLARVVALSAIDVSSTALAGCSGVTVYCPWNKEAAYGWNPGLVASGNHVLAYGVNLSADPITLKVGETANLYDDGMLEAPEGVEVSYAYAAKPLSVETDGKITGKAVGTGEVTATLSLGDVVLARASRTVEVVEGETDYLIARLDLNYGDLLIYFYRSNIPDLDDSFAHHGTAGSATGMTIADCPSDWIYYGHKFLYWTREKNGTGTKFYPGDKVYLNEDISFYAQWKEVSTVQVTFNSMGGSAVSPINGYYGFPLKDMPSNPSRDGYTFGGWCTDFACNISFDSASKIYENTTLYAKWIANTRTVTFDANGGTGGTTKTVNNGSAVSAPANPTRNGYTFAGWYTADNTKYDFSKAVTADMTLYAHWNNNYTIKFNGNNNTGGSTASMSMVYGTAKNLTPNGFTRDGYTFDGWATSSTGGRVYTNGQSVNNLTTTANGTYNLWAKWTANPYKVSFNANGGTGTAPATKNCTYDTSFTMPANPFTRTGYTFGGWCTNTAGTGTTYGVGTSQKNLTTTKNATVPLYAKWDPVWRNVTFHSCNGGQSGDNTAMLLDGELVDAPSKEPERTGYTFTGWYTAESDGVKYDFSKPVTGDLDLYAQWKPITYTVQFEGNGNTSGAGWDRVLEYDAPAYLWNTFSKTGYKFVGWGTSSEGSARYYQDQPVVNLTSIPNDTVTLYAIWAEYWHNVTFDANGGSGGKTVQVMDYFRASAPANPTRNGYTFDGWYTAASGGAKWNFDEFITEDVMLYAHWNNNYTIQFNGNGHTGGSTASMSMVYGTAKNLTQNGFTKTGYTFDGWATSSTGARVYTNGQSVNNLTTTANGTYPLYARWTPNKYTVSFNNNGGTGGQSAQVSATYDAAMPALTTAAPTKTGYTFDGWWDTSNATGGTKYYNANGTSARTWNKASAGTLWARWTANTNTPYVVKHWQQNVDGTASSHNASNYTLKDTENKTGTSDADVTPGVKTYTGFIAPSIQTVKVKPDGTLVVDYYYARNSYTFTLGSAAHVSTSGSSNTGSFRYGATVTLKASASSGYTFKAWESSNGSLVANQANANTTFAMPAGNVTMTPSVTANKYTVSFNNNGGTGGQSAQVSATYDAAMPALTTAAPTKTGYTFDGWWDTSNATGGTKYYNANGTSARTWNKASAGTLWARWTANKYNVVYSKGSGASGNPPLGLSNAVYDTEYVLPNQATLEKTGYTFQGWSEDVNWTTSSTKKLYKTGEKFKNLTAVNGASVTLHAIWKANAYTIQFNGNGHDGGTVPPSMGATYDAVIKLPAVVPTRVGYTFKGWARTNGATSAEFTAGATTTYAPNLTSAPNGSATLYAVWTINSYQVSFQTNGGSAVNAQTINYQGLVDESKTTTTRGGYTFKGWFKDAEFKTAWNFTTDKVPANNITLYAKWQANKFTVNYVPNYVGATQLSTSQEFVYDVEQTLKANTFTRTGYTFAGWGTEPNGSVVYSNKQAKVKNVKLNAQEGDTVTLYAIWTANPYMMLFMGNYPNSNIDNGNITHTLTYTYDQKYNLPAYGDGGCGFACPDYTFIGWNTMQDGSGTKYTDLAEVKNLATTGVYILYAQWRGEEYALSFDPNAGDETVEGMPEGMQMYWGQGETLPEAKPKRAGWVFAGWNTDADGSGTAYAPGAYAHNLAPASGSDAVLYAQWTPIVSVDSPVDPQITLTADATTGMAIEASVTDMTFASKSPVPVRIESIRCDPVSGQTERVFPKQDRWAEIKFELDAGGKNQDPVAIGKGHSFIKGIAPAFEMPAGTKADPGTLTMSMGLSFPADMPVQLVKDPAHLVTFAYTYEAL